MLNSIDPNFLFPLTDALYVKDFPYFTRENLRDAFSSGQVLSKIEIYEALKALKLNIKTTHHLGCWHGLLSLWISNLNDSSVVLSDIDKHSLDLAFAVNRKADFIVSSAEDYIKSRKFSIQDLILNTSCEHMDNSWVLNLKNCLVAAQSTDYALGEGHINTKKSLENFILDLDLKTIFYSSTLTFPMYKRFTVIGMK